MVKNKLGEDAVQQSGWLLDGYPRRCGAGRARRPPRRLLARRARAPRAAAWLLCGTAGRAGTLCTHACLAPVACPWCSGEQAEAIEKEGIRPDIFLLINVGPAGGRAGGAPALARTMWQPGARAPCWPTRLGRAPPAPHRCPTSC